MRGERNAFGIATLYSPGRFWYDDAFERHGVFIRNDIQMLKNRAPAVIIFPTDGIGTGLSRLRETAPRTFEYLNQQLATIGIVNGHE